MRCAMVFTTVNADTLRRRIKRMLLGLVLLLPLPLQASSETWLSVKLDGAKALLYLDLSAGALYVGNDCAPILHFSEAMTLQTRGKALQKVFKVRKQNLSAKSRVARNRLPETITLQGSKVTIQAGPHMGNSRTVGIVVTDRNLSTRRSAKSCSE